MSGFAIKLQGWNIFNRSSYAGPRRFLVIGAVCVAVVGIIAAVSLSGTTAPPVSQVGRLPSINPLPGGLHSNQVITKLALTNDQEQADQAARNGQSYTPPIAASSLVAQAPAPRPPAVRFERPVIPPDQAAAQAARLETTPPAPTPIVHTVQYSPPAIVQSLPQTAPTDPHEAQLYDDAVRRMLRGWDGRSPHTDVQLDPAARDADSRDDDVAAITSGRQGRATPVSIRRAEPAGPRGALLVPAGRGIFAHTVLAVSSDSGGPIVLQADSGPLTGDRMIGTFGQATNNGTGSADRLVVRINSVEHQGHSIGMDAIVIAPDTMETTVASSVDQHYMARFLLPAAAAFIQGLGQALATTSNTVGQLGPLGTTSYVTSLNFPQQVGVGAGAAAQQLGNVLNREAPTGPTIHLGANLNVGVMFLGDVVDSNSR